MRKIKLARIALASIGSVLICTTSIAQVDSEQQIIKQPTYKDYQATAEMHFDLIHTKLEVSFDYAKQQMPGKAWITLKPHFYDQDILILDAKGMIINEVAIVYGGKKAPLSYDYYDSLQLYIALPKTFKKSEIITIYIDYIARPNEIKTKGSAAISDAKGLYFIDPTNEDPDKPTQIWTQGETEATSVWCPTIDKPNQKTTQEIIMTVPAKYVSLSNGALIKQTKNNNGTRTDHWKMDLPHAPYLFFMGVGDYSIIKDKYKNLAVDYYVDPKYASVAKGIFGETPAMIELYSKWVRTPFPWNKYAQIVGEDYVSGAMENTTSTLHGSAAYQNARELVDENKWENVVAHELFHQWFGDLVTAESWSNLTVNESFADYSEYLWMEHKYGKEAADAYAFQAMQGYFSRPDNAQKHLVRFYYNDKEDMFDLVSYQKGGRILHMLRHFVGDSAFSYGMQKYLADNKFKSGEAHQLRLAMEAVTGKDLNWFFNQWYFGAGHPVVTINHNWNDSTKNYSVIIQQRQQGDDFNIPVDIDIYDGKEKTRKTVWLNNTIDTFNFKRLEKPTYVLVDADKTLLWEKEEIRTETEWYTQYKYATNYLDKYEVLEQILSKETAANQQDNDIILKALNDKFYGIRQLALGYYALNIADITPAIEQQIASIAKTDKNRPTRAGAIDVLSAINKTSYLPLFKTSVTDSSYSVAGAALEALINSDQDYAISISSKLETDAKGRLEQALTLMKYLKTSPTDFQILVKAYEEMPPFEKFSNMKGMMYFANRVTDMQAFKSTVDPVLSFYNQYKGIQQIEPAMKNAINWLITKKQAAVSTSATNKEQLEYLENAIK